MRPRLPPPADSGPLRTAPPRLFTAPQLQRRLPHTPLPPAPDCPVREATSHCGTLWNTVRRRGGNKNLFFKKGKGRIASPPAEFQLMTTASPRWQWWQLALNDNGMPAVEFAHLCYFSWHGSGEGLIFLTFDHANLSPDTLFCIYILPVLLFKMCYKLQELS